MPEQKSRRQFTRWWWVLPLLALFIVPLFLFKACLNTAFVRQKIHHYTAQHGVSISYGEVTDFSWWNGILIDTIKMKTADIEASFNHVSYLFGGVLHVAEAHVSADASLFKLSRSPMVEKNSSSPVLLGLLPRQVNVDTLNLNIPQGSYKGRVALSLHAELQVVDAELQGQLQFKYQESSLTSAVQMRLSFNPEKDQLNILQLILKNHNSEVSIKDLQISQLMVQSNVKVSYIAVNSDIKPYASMLAAWPIEHSQLEHVDLEIKDFRYGNDTASLTLKKLSMQATDGSDVEAFGPIAWEMKQQVSRFESSNLFIQLSMPKPQTWGIPVHETSQVEAHLKGALSLTPSGLARLDQLELKSLVSFGDKQWPVILNADAISLQNSRAMLENLHVRLNGEKPIVVAGEEVPAGKYSALLSSSTFDFSDVNKLVWQSSGDIDLEIKGEPALALHLDANGVRKPDSTLFNHLDIDLKEPAVNANIRGTLHDIGLAHRSSRLQGHLSADNMAELRRWVEALPDMDGRAVIDWESEGRGSNRLYVKGKLHLTDFNLNHEGLNLQGGELVLPFRQQLNLTDIRLKKGRLINHADLSRLTKQALPGSLTLKSLSMAGFELNESKLALQLDGDVLIGKVEQGRLLDGNISGYFQLSIAEKKQPYPEAFARLSLVYADSAQLNSEWQAEPSRFNVYATIKSDGSNLSGRLSVPNIRRLSLDHLIIWLDPEGEKASLQNVKQMMDKYGYVPSSTDARLQNQYADVDVVLKSSGGNEMHIPIHNLSVGHLIGE